MQRNSIKAWICRSIGRFTETNIIQDGDRTSERSGACVETLFELENRYMYYLRSLLRFACQLAKRLPGDNNVPP